MPLEQKEKIGLLLSLVTIIGSAIAFIFTLYTWQDQNHIKRADFLENRIKEFHDSSMYLAREILDGFAARWDSTILKGDIQIVTEGSSRDSTHHDIELKNLDLALSHILPDTLNSRQRVRVSFDNLLDFFGKLEYYIGLNLMEGEEVKYFEYYLNVCANSPAIVKYAKDYHFKPFLCLLDRMKKTYKNNSMSEKFLKIFTSLIPFITVVVGVWQFNKGQKEIKEREIVQRNFEVEKINRQASFETLAKFKEYQAEVYKNAIDVVGYLAVHDDYQSKEYKATLTRFWQMYWVGLSSVETPEVESAMVALGNYLKKLEASNFTTTQQTQTDLKNLAYEVAQWIKKSSRTWDLPEGYGK